jgi:uncharacterized protein (DUF1800 family)
MTAATANTAFVASRRRLFGALLASVGGTSTDPSLSMRRPGRSGVQDPDVPLSPDSNSFPPDPVRWLSRGTFGYTNEVRAAFDALGSSDDARWSAWIAQQLDPASIADGACDARIASANFVTLNKSAGQLWTDHHSDTTNYFNRMLPISEAECMTIIRQTYSQRQLYEIMVDFWHDHFSVFGWDYDGGPMFVAFDRDAVRANVLGNFRTMLQAVCESASMMYMLDLYTSYAGHPNENYSRELHELHTLGAENYAGIVDDPDDDPSLPTFVAWDGKIERLQYVDDDVYEAARVLTGWTISQSTYETRNDPNPGTFEYVNAYHDAGVKRVLHRNFSAGGAQSDGITLFNMLAQHPGTAHFVAGKLCRRLVGDTASAALVQSAANLFQAAWDPGQPANQNQIAQVLALILQSDEFKTSWGTKMKRPALAAVSALRATSADFTPVPDNTNIYTPAEEFMGRLQAAGHRLFYWPAPNGYPDNQVAWSSTGALGMTMRMLPRLLEMHQIESYNNGYAFLIDVQGQTLATFPNAVDRSAANIIGYWCDRLFGYRPEPTHGVAVDFFRQEAAPTDALDLITDATDNNGVPQHTGVWHLNPANTLSKHYTIARLRVAIGLLLCSPEFLRR